MEGESTQHEVYGFVIPNRTAGCGPACPVVWEGGGPSPSPYPDFGLGIALVVDLQGLLLYNHEQQGMPQGFLQQTPCGHSTRKNSV